ncbi:MAG: zinc/iron permease [Cryomorphaceae bacterium]|nr:MAG: zinc/iron permease [Cryomorphaceae bacterium]
MTESLERILILFFSAMTVGLLVIAFPKLMKPYLKMLLAFSGALLLGITVMHILPEAYELGGAQVGVFVIAGFLLQIILDYFSGGIEHGHVHHPAQHHEHEHGKAITWTMLLSLCIHAFTESLPLGFDEQLHHAHDHMHNHGHHHHHHSHQGYLWGIVIHNIPITIALVGMMLGLKMSRAKTILFLFIFAASAPIGILVSPLISNNGQDMVVFSRILALAGGIILHLSTTILFETGENHRFNLYKMVVILAGFGLALLAS